MRKIRVLYSGDTSALNGASLYVARLIKHANLFKQSGYELTLSEADVIKSSYKGNASEYNNSIKYKIKKRIKTLFSKTYIGSIAYIYFAWLRHARKVSNFKIEGKEDCILANDIFCAYYALKRGLKIPVILVMHNSGNSYTMLLRTLPKANVNLIKKRLEKISSEVYKNAAAVVFVSDTSRELFLRENPDFSGIAMHITEGLEDVECNYIHDFSSLSFITIGSVCKRKNQFSVIKMFLDEKVREAHLSVIGTGDDYERCCRFVEDNKLNNVDMVGAVDNKDIVSWLNKSNVFILNSLDEGLPAVGIEALRNGLPIIISDVGGCRELIDENGILLKPNCEEDLRLAIRKFNDGSLDLKEMSRKSRELFEKKYAIGIMIDQYISLFNKIQNRGKNE